MILTRAVDVLTVLSNLFILIPFATALVYHRWTRAWIFFWMCWASFIYHLCDSFGACLFSFNMHHHLDFFFAQWLIVITALYLIEFTPRYAWLERGLILLGGVAIVILQITLSAELFVQAAMVGVSLAGVVLYWILCGVPHYHWGFLTLGFSLIAASVLLYTIQNLVPQGYWGIHSLWHTAAAIGQHFFLQIKRPAPRLAGVDRRIYWATK